MKSETQIKYEEHGGFYKPLFIIVILCSICFWNLKPFPPIFNIYHFIGWGFCGLAVLLVWNKPGLSFKYPIFLFLFGLLANFFASYKNLHQNLYESFFSFSFYYFILIYFLLHFMKLKAGFVENTILVFAFLYSLIFIYQYKAYPRVIFNFSAQTALEEKQFEILGHGFLVLGYLLALNKFLMKYRWIYLALAMAFMLVLFKCGFRTLIGSALAASVIMIARLIRFNIRDMILGIVVVLGFLALSQYKSVSHIIDNAISKTESNMKEGKAYIRNVEKEYYYNVYPRNISYYVIGGGKPAGRSLYRFDYDISTVKLNYNIVWVDIGLIGFYFVVGGITLLGMLWWALKAIFSKLPREMTYLSFYFLYLLFTSFTNEEMYRDGIFTVQAIALYLVDLGVRKRTEEASQTEKSVN
jgi:hypothetical protein